MGRERKRACKEVLACERRKCVENGVRRTVTPAGMSTLICLLVCIAPCHRTREQPTQVRQAALTSLVVDILLGLSSMGQGTLGMYTHGMPPRESDHFIHIVNLSVVGPLPVPCTRGTCRPPPRRCRYSRGTPSASA